MLGTIVIRSLLVIGLIVAAHAIKPFSIKNVTQHLLYSTRSFAMVLPEDARTSLDQATTVALGLSGSFFGDNPLEGEPADQFLVMQAQPQSRRSAARIWPPDEPLKPGRKAKPSPKRSAPAKRIERSENNQIAALSAAGDQSSVALAAMDDALAELKEEAEVTPVILPVISEEIAARRPLPVSFLQSNAACKEQEAKTLHLIAAVNVIHLDKRLDKRLRASWKLIEKPGAVAPECEGEKPDAGQTEVTAPEAEEPEMVEHEEEVEPEAGEAEEMKAPLAPLKCPIIP